MKIEKINDNQIRCTLTSEDLAQRQLRLSELAYGTDKARALFRDLMQQAAAKYGFFAENMPLMIEAVPTSSDSIVLVVTKVENPEELDTRFASFAPGVQAVPGESADEPNAFEQLINTISKAAEGAQSTDTPAGAGRALRQNAQQLTELRNYLMLNRLYAFSSMNEVIEAARASGGSYRDESTLVLDEADGTYYLMLSMPTMEEVSLQQSVLAALSEFGTQLPATGGRRRHLSEHCRVLIEGHALHELCKL